MRNRTTGRRENLGTRLLAREQAHLCAKFSTNSPTSEPARYPLSSPPSESLGKAFQGAQLLLDLFLARSRIGS